VRGRIRAQSVSDHRQYPIHIVDGFVIPETKNSVITLSQPLIACLIVSAICMLATIDLKDQPLFSADEINDVATERLLASEFMSIDEARSQLVPKAQFCICRIATQTPSQACFDFVGLAHKAAPPHPTRFARRPLPACGER
jgi:hypothetical protein